MGNHTETIEAEYDPEKTDYSELLRLFWKNHNPTSNSKPQYMSAIFYFDEEQKELAEQTLKQEQKLRMLPITTKVVPAGEIYDAEFYHQKFSLQRHPLVCNTLHFDEDNAMITSHVAARLNGYLAKSAPISQFEKEWRSWGIPDIVAQYVLNQLAGGAKFMC